MSSQSGVGPREHAIQHPVRDGTVLLTSPRDPHFAVLGVLIHTFAQLYEGIQHCTQHVPDAMVRLSR